MDLSGAKKQDYTNVPMTESSFFSSDSITSRTPLTQRGSPSPESPNELDQVQENPYEIPLDFETNRLRHEESMIAQRTSHRKKKSPLYELTKVNGVQSQSLRRQFSDEDCDVPFVKYNERKYNCLFIILFVFVILALASGGVALYVILKDKFGSSQTKTVQAASKGIILRVCILFVSINTLRNACDFSILIVSCVRVTGRV